MALMRPDHPLAARLAVRFAELAVEPFLGLSGSMALQQLYRRGGGGPADRSSTEPIRSRRMPAGMRLK